jgi:hypothetical protein
MARTIAVLFILVLCFTTTMQAQAPTPKPGPEVKKLHVLVGRWTYEGEYKPGPLGPGGKVSGEYDGRMILGGFFFEGRATEKGPAGQSRGLEIDGYDPVNKNFSYHYFMDDGSALTGALTVAGNTWTGAAKLVTAGKQYQFKGTFVLAADLASGTFEGEISVDGKTWTPWFEMKYTKVPPAAKK